MILAADLHLQQCAWTRHPEIRHDSYFALSQIMRLAQSTGQDLVLAGDIFDCRPDVETAAQTVEWLGGQYELAVYYIGGQHDRDERHWLEVLSDVERVKHVHAKTFELDGLVLYGLDWLPAEQFQAALRDLPQHIDCLVCHQVWGDLNPFNAEAWLADLPYDLDVLSGDFHQTLTVQAGRRTLLSPGSTCMQSVKEPFAKYVLTYSRQHATWTKMPLVSRPFMELDLANDINLDLVAAELSAPPHPAFSELGFPEVARSVVVARVPVRDDPPVLSRLRDLVRAKQAHLLVRPYTDGLGIVEDIPAAQITVHSEVLQTCLAAAPESVRDVLPRLLAAEDPEVVLASWLDGTRAAVAQGR